MLFINTDTSELGFTFVGIRKNASTSIGSAIYSLKNNIAYDHPDFPEDINASDIFMYNSEKDIRNLLKFTCIRDPFERLVSGFTHKVLQHPGIEIKQYAEVVPHHKEMSDNIKKYFDSFLTFLEEYGLSEIDYHFALQYDCAKFDSIDYEIILNQSNLSSDWFKVQNAISGMPNLPSKIIHESGSSILLNMLSPFQDRVKVLYARDYDLIS